MLRKLLLALVLVAASPATAGAATVFVSEGDDIVPGFVGIEGLRLERNDLVVTMAGGFITIRERGPATLRADDRCRRLRRRAVRCDVREVVVEYLFVDGGRGDDRLRVEAPREIGTVQVEGGPGDDRLRTYGAGALSSGGPGRDVLLGGPRRDELLGGGGSDRLYGRGGDDRLGGDIHVSGIESVERRAGIARDLLSGGRGTDMARYDERRRGGVVVDLARGRGGEDRLRSIESAAGTGGRDVLRGDARANRLLGSGGADTLIGRGGRDRLNTGWTAPSNTGGGDGDRDRLSCGAGADVVSGISDGEALPRSCERLHLAYELATPYVQLLRRGRRRVRTQVACASESLDCLRTVTLWHRGRLIGRSERVHLTAPLTWLTIALRRALPRSGIVVVSARGSDGEEPDFDDEPRRVAYHLTYRLLR